MYAIANSNSPCRMKSISRVLLIRGRSVLWSASRVQSTSVPVEVPRSRIRASMESVVDAYEEFIGVKGVKAAQAGVMEWENRLNEAQVARRQKQSELKQIQRKLKEIHVELDRTARGEDRYLHLLTEEHQLIKKERGVLDEFEQFETTEREAFHLLSTRVRESHEKERERAEKTKWWSVSASLTGALLGIIGTSIGNELRMRRFREMLPATNETAKEMAAALQEHNDKVSAFLCELKESLHADSLQVTPKHLHIDTADAEKALSQIRAENERLASQMEELARLAKLDHALQQPENVVYVGNEMERLLDETERKLESKMKLQTLLSVVFVYAAIGVTIPLAFAFFRGG